MNKNRIPTLDGWRGIAILFVLLTHYQDGILRHNLFGQRWLDLGQHGVTIFFVLSGFLITSNLLLEKSIDLCRFYIHRFFRLMPAAGTYLLILVLITAFTSWKVIGHDLWAALFFYRNYLGETPTSSSTLHFWSLSLEEQFYLVWPPVLALIRRRNAMIAAIAGVIGMAAYRWMYWAYYSVGFRFIHTEVRAGALLVGCLLSLVLQDEQVKAMFVKHPRAIFYISLTVLAVDIHHFHALIPLTEALSIALMIGVTIHNPDMWPSRVLEFDHLKLTGKMSYSFYIWQDFFLRYNFAFYGLFLLPVVASGSYAFIELPGIALGRKLLQRREPVRLEVASG